MNMFRDALSAGFSAIQDIAGDPITLRRGNVESPSFGVIGQSDSFDQDSGGQTVVVTRSIDWLVAVANYKLNNALTKPAMNDTIVSDGRTFRVQSLGGPVWQYSDPRRTHYRIHTVEVT